jgi:hypothetical protein
MYDYGARNYDPSIGRWMNVDPLAEVQPDKTPYHFCSNNPINRTDPTGMIDGWIEEKEGNKSTFTYRGGIDTVQQAKDAGFTNAVGVTPAHKVWNESLGYSYNLNSNGTVSDADGNNVISGAFGNMTTEGGTTIRSFGMAETISSEIYPKATGACTPMEFSSPFFSWGWAAKGLGYAWNSVFGAAASTTAEASGSVYSVAYQTTLSSELFPAGSYYGHFKAANTSLSNAMASDAAFSSSMSSLGVSIPRSATGTILGKSPTNWVWHHSVETGVMQLVPKTQHTSGSLFWNTMHPNGLGGMATWNK